MDSSSAKTAIETAAGDIERVVDAIELVTSGKGLKEMRPEKDVQRGDESFGFWFRGHSSASHALVPSIQRNSINKNTAYIDEISLVRHFKAMNCDVVESMASDFDVLVTMQHYLAPTRLLDWTENLLIALHFAVRDPECDKQDGALWILNARRLNQWTSASSRVSRVLFQNELDTIARSALSRVRHRDNWHDYLKNYIRAHPLDGEQSRTDRLLKAISEVQLQGAQINHLRCATVDIRHLQFIRNGVHVEKDLLVDEDRWHEPELLDVRLRAPVAVYPNRANRRVRAQSGCFTLHGGSFHPQSEKFEDAKVYRNYIGVPITLHEINRGLAEGERVIQWWRIPSAKKADIRRALAQIGITDAALFPELDYQARYLVQRWALNNA